MLSDPEPRTEAGRALLSIGDEFRFARPEYAVREAVLAIEAEAARLALEDVAERVRGLRDEFAQAAERWEASADEARKGNHRASFAGEDDLPAHVLSRTRMLVFRHVVESLDAVLALLSTKEDGIVSDKFLIALFVPVFMLGVSVGMMVSWALLV